jgi:hypothetical protein
MAEQMGCAPETLRKHCRYLRQRTGDDSLLDAALGLLRELAGGQEP